MIFRIIYLYVGFSFDKFLFIENKTCQATIFPPVEICLGELNDTDSDK